MTNDNDPSPLARLRQEAPPALDRERERARRKNITAAIAELQRTGFASPPPRASSRMHSGFGLHTRKPVTLGLAAFGALLVLSVAWFALGPPTPSTHPVARLNDTARLIVGSGQIEVQSGTQRTRFDAGHELSVAADASLSATNDDVALVLPSNADLALTRGSQMRLAREVDAATGHVTAERVALERGRVSLRVPKLSAQQTLSVRTADALVEVHGTQFSVELSAAPNGDMVTRVQVSEGVVSVTSKGQRSVLYAGQSWSSELNTTTIAPTTSAASSALPSDLPSKRQAPSAEGNLERTSPPTSEESELAEQNRLFQSALAARNRGATELAATQLATLMARYPRSELAHNARVEHFRVLGAAGRHGEASASARAYLRDYPKGFARAEAARVAGH